MGLCFHLYYIPCIRLSHFIVLISEIQPVKHLNKQKNLSQQHETHHISSLKNFMLRLHRVLALVCSWGGNSGIKPKTFGFGSVFCWIGTEIIATGCRLGLPARLPQSKRETNTMVWPAGEGLPSSRCVCSACRRLRNDVCCLQRRWS